MSAASDAKRTLVTFVINNADMTKDINERLLSMSFTDVEDGGADDFEMTLEDRDGKVIGSWLNTEINRRAKANKNKADKVEIRPTIHQKNWNGDGKDISLRCGTFTLDDIDMKGPPCTVTMRASAADFSAGGRRTKRSKAWEKTTLKKIANVIGARDGYSVMYLTDRTIQYTRVEQSKQTDTAFLQKLCTRAGLSMKITNATIVIFDAAEYEKKTEVRTIEKGDGSYGSFQFGAKLSDSCYDACVVTYDNAETGKTYKGSYPEGYETVSAKTATNQTTNNTYTGKLVDAEFTAYYPYNSIQEGGYYAYNGEKLNPGSYTCAAPHSVPLGTKIQVQGTGTDKDGKVYRVNDRGGAIKIKNGVYCIDLLMSSAKKCNAFGRRRGKALIISKTAKTTKKTSSSSASASSSGSSSGTKDIIDVAISQIGCYGSDANKFSRFTSTYGAFWCHSFVSWCANRAGVPTSVFPNTASTDTGMAFFKRKGQFKYKGSYTPKRGDVIYFKTGASHVGLVEYVKNGRVYTIEGNTTGDWVRRRDYALSYRTITGYGVPRYSYIKGDGYSESTSSSSEDDSKVLKVTDVMVSSNKEAAALAKAKLREANKGEISASFTMAGDITLCAGLTIKVKGFGAFDGKYIIEQARHTISKSAGFQTQISLRQVITEY